MAFILDTDVFWREWDKKLDDNIYPFYNCYSLLPKCITYDLWKNDMYRIKFIDTKAGCSCRYNKEGESKQLQSFGTEACQVIVWKCNALEFDVSR